MNSSVFGFKSLGNDTNGTPKEIYPSFQPTKKDCIELSEECKQLSSIERADRCSLVLTNGDCRPAAEYGGKSDNRRHQVVYRMCVRATYGIDIDPRELSDEQKDESSLLFKVKDEYDRTVTCIGCNTDLKAKSVEHLLQHDCKGETSIRCQYCGKTPEELSLDCDDSHKKGMHVNNAMSNHERLSCPSNPKFSKPWADFIAFLKKQGPVTTYGEIPFTGYPRKTEAERMYNKLVKAVGRVKSLRPSGKRQALPVEGDKRAQLEELGYTVDNGFLYD